MNVLIANIVCQGGKYFPKNWILFPDGHFLNNKPFLENGAQILFVTLTLDHLPHIEDLVAVLKSGQSLGYMTPRLNYRINVRKFTWADKS